MRNMIALATALLAGCAAAPHTQPRSDAPTTPRLAADAPALTAFKPLDAAIQAAFAATGPSIVQVWFGEGDMLSGTIISEDGLVLTCAHLPVPVGGDAQLGLSDGRRVPATVLSKLPAPGRAAPLIPGDPASHVQLAAEIAAAARPASDAVVEIHSNARWIALGCIVGDGLILTKASELGPNLTAVLADGAIELVLTHPAQPPMRMAQRLR
jgi:S1-C subfamily serine protease